jgi:hypothetical protein
MSTFYFGTKGCSTFRCAGVIQEGSSTFAGLVAARAGEAAAVAVAIPTRRGFFFMITCGKEFANDACTVFSNIMDDAVCFGKSLEIAGRAGRL